MTLETFKNELPSYEQMLAYTEMSDSTKKKYMLALRNFLVYTDTNMIHGELSKNLFIEYKDYLVQKYKPNTVNLYTIALNKYLQYIGASGLRVKFLRIQRNNSLENCITVDEYKRMLAIAEKLNNNAVYYIIQSLAGTGVRISELRFITVEAVKVGSSPVQNKGKFRCVIIPDQLCRELERYCKEKGIENGHVFRGRSPDKGVNPATVRRWLKKVAELAGISPQKAFPHNFRHLFAKRFMDIYNDLPELADMLGHTNLETTRIYTRTSTAEKREKLNNLFY